MHQGGVCWGVGGPGPIRLVIKCLCKLIWFDIEAYVDQLSNAYLMRRTNKNHTVKIIITISVTILNVNLGVGSWAGPAWFWLGGTVSIFIHLHTIYLFNLCTHMYT